MKIKMASSGFLLPNKTLAWWENPFGEGREPGRIGGGKPERKRLGGSSKKGE